MIIFQSVRLLLIPPTCRLPQFPKRICTHLQHRLKPFPSLTSILPKPLDTKVLNCITQPCEGPISRDLRILLKEGLGVGVCGVFGIDDGFLDREQVGEGQVGGSHCDDLFSGVHLANFADIRLFCVAEDFHEPSGSALFACDKAFGSELGEEEEELAI